MLFIHLGALVELYWGKRGGGPLSAGGLFWGLNVWGPNRPTGAVVHLRALTSCWALTMLIALLHKSW